MPDRFTAVAKKLINNWKTEFVDDWSLRKIDEKNVKNLLAFLVKAGTLKVPGISTSLAAISVIVGEIKKIQRDLGLRDDGFFGRLTNERFRKFMRACAVDESTPTGLVTGGDAQKFNKGLPKPMIFYHANDKMVNAQPFDGKSSMYLLENAWGLWQQYADVFVRRVLNENDANVRIELGKIDGIGNTLGLAHLGGPEKLKTLQLRLTMDANEDWNAARFLSSTAHEIGHILGLQHSPDPDQLMHSRLNFMDPVQVPGSDDIAQIKTEWGAAIAPGREAKKPSDDFPGKLIIDEILR